MNLQNYLRNLKPSERIDFAEKCGTTVAYLYQVAGKHRMPGAGLCRRIEAESQGEVLKEILRPDYFASG